MAGLLPALSTLAKEISSTSAITQSIQFLRGRRGVLSNFDDVEEFALRADESRDHVLKACEHHLVRVRAAIAQRLWSRQVFIGVSVIDALVFRAIAASPNPVKWVLEFIREGGLHSPGLVIYPVHSLGFLGVGFFQAITGKRLRYISRPYGLALSPQTNSFKDTCAFLQDAARVLGVRLKLPMDLIEHWDRSRATKWLTSNPLMALKVHSFPGGYHENQFFLLNKLRFSATFIVMLTSLQPPLSRAVELDRLSSSRLNNHETLDLRHYIVLFPHKGGRKLSGDCVPMNLGRPALAAISDLGVEIDPVHWRRPRKLHVRLHRALQAAQGGYFRHGLFNRDDLPGRVYRQVVRSLTFFRRSFQQRESNDEAIVSLAVAFELLLTDHYLKGINKHIQKRLALALRGTPGTRALRKSVAALYAARSEIVHQGVTKQDLDVSMVRRTYVHAFMSVAEKLRRLPAVSGSPIGDILGDKKS